MSSEWNWENPRKTLQSYYEDRKKFVKVTEEKDRLESDLKLIEEKLNSKEAELKNNQKELQSRGAYMDGNMESVIREIEKDTESRIAGENANYEKRKADLFAEMNKEIQANDDWKKKRLAELFGDSFSSDENWTDVEMAALDFEKERREFKNASDNRIMKYENDIEQENLDCKNYVAEKGETQQQIYAKYEPELTRYQNLIDGIIQKYEPEVNKCLHEVNVKKEAREEELDILKSEMYAEEKNSNDALDRLRQQKAKIEADWDAQIKMARKQEKPITALQNRKTSALNRKEEEIQKTLNSGQNKVNRLKSKYQIVDQKHTGIIEKAENKLRQVENQRDAELEEPNANYINLLRDRDGQINQLQTEIDQRENDSNRIISDLQTKIATENQSQINKDADIDRRMADYAMNGDNCLSDVLDETVAPYAALKERIDSWRTIISAIKKDKMEKAYPKEYQKQKDILMKESYEDLQKELQEVSNYKDRQGIISQNQLVFTIAGAILAVTGIILLVVLYVVLQRPIGFIGIPIIVVGIALGVFTIIKCGEEFKKLCKYVSLASDYKEFPAIISHATGVTRDKELAAMKEMGKKMFDGYYGREEIEKIHDEKDADIKGDYERNKKFAERDHEDSVAIIRQEKEKKIKALKEDEKNYSSKKKELEKTIETLSDDIEKLKEDKNKKESEIAGNNQFCTDFESNYEMLEKKLEEKEWTTKLEDSEALFSEYFYIVPENQNNENEGGIGKKMPRMIYEIGHDDEGRKNEPLVILYDADDNDPQTIQKLVKDMMLDLMYCIYRMNSKGTYEQYIVDPLRCTDVLKARDIKRMLYIEEISERMEDLRGSIKVFNEKREKLLMKGKTLDEVNKKKIEKKDRTEPYALFYRIFGPEERKSSMDADIKSLIQDNSSSKYGFFPVFICDRNAWEDGQKEKSSVYKELKTYVKGGIVCYNGSSYSMY